MTTAKETNPLLTAKECADRLGVKTRTFHQWRHRRHRGTGAVPIPEPAAYVGPIPQFRWLDVLRWAGRTGHIRLGSTVQEYRDRYIEEPVPARAGGTLPSGPPSRRRRRSPFDPKKVI